MTRELTAWDLLVVFLVLIGIGAACSSAFPQPGVTSPPRPAQVIHLDGYAITIERDGR